MPEAKGSSARVTIAHFDKIADRYGGRYEEQTPVGYAFRTRRQRVLDLLDAPGGRVLDVGCGPGVMVEDLCARGWEFWGVDPAGRMIEEARAAFASTPAAHFSVGVADDLHFADQSFDAVVCMGVIERLADDAVALEEMARVLRPGGSLIVTAPNRTSPALWWRDHVFYPVVALLRPLRDRLTGRLPIEPVRGHRVYDRSSLAAALAVHGCEVTDVDYCAYPVVLAPFDQVFLRLTTALLRRLEGLRRTRARALGAVIVVRAKKV